MTYLIKIKAPSLFVAEQAANRIANLDMHDDVYILRVRKTLF